MASFTLRSALVASITALLTIQQTQAQMITQASTTVAMNALTAVGCFATAAPMVDHGPAIFQTSGNCQPICYELQKSVMGLVNGTNCYCGDLIPPNSTQVSQDNCNTPCAGYDKDFCGGANYWQVYLTGITRNHIQNLDAALLSSSSSSATATRTQAAQTVLVTTTASVDPKASGGSNTVGIAVGVVVAVVVMIGGAFGAWAFMRHKRRRDAEEEGKRQLAVDAFVSGGKHHPQSSISDSRLDPVLLAAKRESTGSIMDNADYSRRILQVRNPDGY